MAKMLIENLAAEWDPSKYTDEYRENLMKLIRARIKGEKPKLAVRGAAAGRQGRRPDGAAAAEPRAESEARRPRRARKTRARRADKDPREEEDPPRGVMAMRRLLATIVLLAMASAACRETGDVQVTSIKFRGATAVKADELKAVLATRESGFLPWSRKRFFDRPEFDRDVQRIEAFYADRGYPKAKVVNVDVKLNDAKDKVAITVEIAEGEPIVVESVAFEGSTPFPQITSIDSASGCRFRQASPAISV